MLESPLSCRSPFEALRLETALPAQKAGASTAKKRCAVPLYSQEMRLDLARCLTEHAIQLKANISQTLKVSRRGPDLRSRTSTCRGCWSDQPPWFPRGHPGLKVQSFYCAHMCTYVHICAHMCTFLRRYTHIGLSFLINLLHALLVLRPVRRMHLPTSSSGSTTPRLQSSCEQHRAALLSKSPLRISFVRSLKFVHTTGSGLCQSQRDVHESGSAPTRVRSSARHEVQREREANVKRYVMALNNLGVACRRKGEAV